MEAPGGVEPPTCGLGKHALYSVANVFKGFEMGPLCYFVDSWYPLVAFWAPLWGTWLPWRNRITQEFPKLKIAGSSPAGSTILTKGEY